MISANKMNVAPREVTGNIERRLSRKWIYLGAGAIGIIAILFLTAS